MALFERQSTRDAREQLEFEAWVADVCIRRTQDDLTAAVDANDMDGAAKALAQLSEIEITQSRILSTDPAVRAWQDREDASLERIRHSMYDAPPRIDYSDS